MREETNRSDNGLPEVTKEHRCHGGQLQFYTHQSYSTATEMVFASYRPDSCGNRPAPTMLWLSGLTCTPENFVTKAGAFEAASRLGLQLIIPDTSPRGTGVPADQQSYDLGEGASFYVNATRQPWQSNFQMFTYVTEELISIATESLGVDGKRLSISGHSMGGHGALICGLKRQDLFKSISAFAPLVAPSQVPWGKQAFTAFFGEDCQVWQQYDATEIGAGLEDMPSVLIDQGDSDEFLEKQLRPSLFKEAIPGKLQDRLQLRMQTGYDHSYYFVSTFIGDHLKFHRDHL